MTSRRPPRFLYHWSPVSNRASIEAEGLRPGNLANTVDWTPPHICYGETPSAALGLTLLDVPLDLWQVRTHGHRFRLANEDREWRTREQVEAWWVATRVFPRDTVAPPPPGLDLATMRRP